MVDRARFEFAPRVKDLHGVSRPPPIWKVRQSVTIAKEAISPGDCDSRSHYRADLPAHGFAHVVRVAMLEVMVKRIVE